MTDTWMKILDIVNMYHLEHHDYQSDEHDTEVRAIVKAMQAHWNPVDDSLPEHDGEYLVTTVNDCGTRRRQVSSFVLFNGGTCYSWGIETSPMYKVLAWCELPPEWEGENG